MWRFSFAAEAHHADAFLAALDDIPGASAYAEAEPAARGPGRWRIHLLCAADRLPHGVDARIGRVAEALGIARPALAGDELPDLDWVARSERRLGPVAVGRFRIRGRHVAGCAGRAVEDILIDAGRAFGSGHHATTRGCLAAIDRIARRRRIRRALDLGTGSGVLAIAIARRMRAPVTAVDIDPIAVAVAADNVRRNGVAHLVRTAIGNGRRRISPRGGVDLVVANILARPLMGLAPAIADAARRRAVLVLAGLQVGEQAAVAAAYRRRGFVPMARLVEEGWATLMLARPGATANDAGARGGPQAMSRSAGGGRCGRLPLAARGSGPPSPWATTNIPARSTPISASMRRSMRRNAS